MTMDGELAIRELQGPAEFRQAEALQRAAWGMDDLDVMPAAAMIAVAHEGGLAAGAFDGERLVGLVFSFPSANPRRHHSHMLGVLPEYRRRGVGLRLKLFQRQWCLQRGVQVVTWTYDPLLAANAHLNVARLGCVVRTYLPDFYGPLSGMYAGLPTDRFLAEWELASPRVSERIEAAERAPGEGRPEPAEPCPASQRAVAIPADFAGLMRSDPARAMRWRLETRALFLELLGDGHVVTGFVLGGDAPFYVLERG